MRNENGSSEHCQADRLAVFGASAARYFPRLSKRNLEAPHKIFFNLFLAKIFVIGTGSPPMKHPHRGTIHSSRSGDKQSKRLKVVNSPLIVSFCDEIF